MASVIKRNKNILSKVQSNLMSELKGSRMMNYKPGQPYSLIYTNFQAPERITKIKDSYVNPYIRVNIYLTRPNIKIIENEGKLIIGIDLSSGFEYGFREDMLEDSFSRALADPNNRNSPAIDFTDSIRRDVHIGPSDFANRYSDTVKEKFHNTRIWKELVEYFESRKSGYFIELQASEYPFSPRDLLPVFVFDSETLDGWYINDNSSYDLNYRKNHNPVSLYGIDKQHCRRAVGNLPFKLTDLHDQFNIYTLRM